MDALNPQTRMRESATRLPAPVQLSDAPRVIPGQMVLPLVLRGGEVNAPRADESDRAWLARMMREHGAGPEGSR